MNEPTTRTQSKMRVIEIELPHSNEPDTLSANTIDVVHEGGGIRVWLDQGEQVKAYAAGRWAGYDLFSEEESQS